MEIRKYLQEKKNELVLYSKFILIFILLHFAVEQKCTSNWQKQAVCCCCYIAKPPFWFLQQSYMAK